MRSQSGFGIITVIVVLVLLATLSAGLVALGTSQSTTVSQDVLSTRADQAARAGVQWGLFRAFSGANNWDGGASCDAAAATFATPVSSTLSLAAVNGFQVTVSCGSILYREGETGNPPPNNHRTVRVYRITAIACPAGATPCPRNDGTTATAAYVERRREATGL